MRSFDSFQGTFESFDRTKLAYHFYEQKGAADTLVVLHGHGEHSGRYEKLTRFLKCDSLNIALFDFRGHGDSEGRRVYLDSYEEYLNDVSSFVSFLKQKFGVQGKIILLGHSFGGLVAIHWALRFPEKIRALILSSPCLGLCLPKWLVGLNAVLNRLAPGFIYKNPVYPPHLTHNPEEVEIYKKDLKIQRRISVRLIYEMLRAMKKLDEIPVFRFPFPVFILMAGIEKVVDPRKTRTFFEKVQALHKEIKIFEGFYHETFNELGQEQVFEVLTNYLREIQRLPRA